MKNIKRIDFLGVPGSGKSSVYAGLLRKRTKRDWLTPEEAKLKIARSESFSRRTFKNTTKSFLSNLPGFKWAGGLLVEAVVSPIEDDVLWSQRDKWKNFLEACITAPQLEETHPVRILQDLSYLLDRVKDVALLKHFGFEGEVIFEDSLSQRAGMVLAHSGRYEDLFSFEVLRPAAVIYLKTSPKLVLERIKGRSKVILKHRGLSNNELMDQLEREIIINDKIFLSAQKNGIKVCELDASAGLSYIIQSASKFVLDL